MNVINTPKTISIDFDANEIRVVEGKASKKGIIISKSVSIKIPEDIYTDGTIEDMDQMIYLLKTGLSENKISAGTTYAVVNSSKIVSREVLFPKVDATDIDNLIKFQLGDYIPIHPEDYVVKYINQGNFLDNGVEKLNLLLIGIPTNIVESHFNLLNSVGLKPTVLDFKSNAICKLLSFGDYINNQIVGNKTIAFVDMSFENTGLTIVKDEHIKVSRIVEGGSNLIAENIREELQIEGDVDLNHKDSEPIVKKEVQDIMDRIEMIFRYYRTREIGNNIDLIILHGELSKVNNVEKMFSAFFNVNTTKLNSINKLKFEGDLSIYANAIGGLLRLNGVKS